MNQNGFLFFFLVCVSDVSNVSGVSNVGAGIGRVGRVLHRVPQRVVRGGFTFFSFLIANALTPPYHHWSTRAMSIPALNHDPDAAFTISEQYKTDPGSSPDGAFITIEQAILKAGDYADKVRIMVTGNVEECASPIVDFYPSISDATHPLAHKWTIPDSDFVNLGEDVMGGMVGGFSGSCWFYGTELADKQDIPIGLVLSAYGGSPIEGWMDKESLFDPAKFCPGEVPSQQSNMYNGMIAPLQTMTIKGKRSMPTIVHACRCIVSVCARARACPMLTLSSSFFFLGGGAYLFLPFFFKNPNPNTEKVWHGIKANKTRSRNRTTCTHAGSK